MVIKLSITNTLKKNMKSLRTIEAEISLKFKNNAVRPKFTGSYRVRKLEFSGLITS